jgi:hypothetical protein
VGFAQANEAWASEWDACVADAANRNTMEAYLLVKSTVA